MKFLHPLFIGKIATQALANACALFRTAAWLAACLTSITTANAQSSVSSASSIASASSESRFSIQVGMAQSKIADVRTYNTRGRTESSTDSRNAPYIELAYRPATMFRLTLAYTSLNGLNARRIAPFPDIFNELQPNMTIGQVITPYSIQEKIDLVSLTPSFVIPLADRWNLDLGPSLDFLHSYATIAGRQFSSSTQRVGGRVGLEYRFADHLKLALLYRYTASPERHMDTLGFGLGYEF